MTTQSLHPLYPFTGKGQEASLGEINAGQFPTDVQLWKEFREGSDKAYTAIYQRYAAGLYGYGLKQVQDKDLVKDCIQEFFIKLWRVKERLGEVYALGPYLFKSFRRFIHNEAAGQSRAVSSDSALDKETIPSTEHSLIEKEQFNSQQQALKNALEKLTEKEREIIYLKFYGHLEYDEIAEVLNIEKKSVYNFTTRALKHLRHNLKDLYLITALFLVPYIF